jgi:ABC-type transport system involved in multi-copper enzyme maturation permease subunit
MRQFLAIALSTFREAVRNKILYSILVFAIALIALALGIGAASLSQNERILKDVGLFAMHFFSNIIAVFMGVTMVFQELQRKTIYNVLSKPVSRFTYFFGKYTGMAAVLAVQLVVMTVALIFIMKVRADLVPIEFFYAAWLAYVECLLILGFALFFSSFSTPYVSGFLTLGVWSVGGLLQNLALHHQDMDLGFSRALAGFFVAVSPDLSFFNLATQLAYSVPVDGAYVLHASFYGLSYTALLLLAGSAIFARRDFI